MSGGVNLSGGTPHTGEGVKEVSNMQGTPYNAPQHAEASENIQMQRSMGDIWVYTPRRCTNVWGICMGHTNIGASRPPSIKHDCL